MNATATSCNMQLIKYKNRPDGLMRLIAFVRNCDAAVLGPLIDRCMREQIITVVQAGNKTWFLVFDFAPLGRLGEQVFVRLPHTATPSLGAALEHFRKPLPKVAAVGP